MTSAYEFADDIIKTWAKKHSLSLSNVFNDREVRSAYISSLMGECFHIWIEPPSERGICIFAACVEGRRDNAQPQQWSVPSAELAATLERVYQAVVEWMAPSERFFPKGSR